MFSLAASVNLSIVMKETIIMPFIQLAEREAEAHASLGRGVRFRTLAARICTD
jgi:hypothetical protein